MLGGRRSFRLAARVCRGFGERTISDRTGWAEAEGGGRIRREAEAGAGTHPQQPYVDLHGSCWGGAGRSGVSEGRWMFSGERRASGCAGCGSGGGVVDGGRPVVSWLRVRIFLSERARKWRAPENGHVSRGFAKHARETSHFFVFSKTRSSEAKICSLKQTFLDRCAEL